MSAEHTMPLFSKRVIDICQNRHLGNAESVGAFQSIRDRLTKRQKQVLVVIRESSAGCTVDEIAQILWTTPNAVSGRCTELKIKGLIRKSGTRETRGGCRAAILIAV